MMDAFAVVLAAAGQSRRFKDRHYKKPFAKLGQRAVWLHSAEKFLHRDDVRQLIVVVAEEDHQFFMEQFGPNVAILGIDVVTGGANRADSVQNGLTRVRDEIRFVAVHDAARPCLADTWIDQVFEAGVQTGAAILASPVTDTLKRVEGGSGATKPGGKVMRVSETVSRQGLWAAQTPQVFEKQLLIDAFARRGKRQPTDEAELVETHGHPVTIVECSQLNLKITVRDDLKLAQAILGLLPKPKLDTPAHPFADDHL